MSTTREVVDNGIRVLAEHYNGNSWVWDINVDAIEQQFSTSCVLTQLFGSYHDGLDTLGIESCAPSHEHGFTPYDNPEDDGMYREDLNDVWKASIKEIRTGIPREKPVVQETVPYTIELTIDLTYEQIGRLFHEFGHDFDEELERRAYEAIDRSMEVA